MSVINRMLAELDARRAKTPAAGSDAVIAPAALRATSSSRRLQVIALLGVVAIAAVAFGNWPGLVGAAPAHTPRPVAVLSNAGDATPAPPASSASAAQASPPSDAAAPSAIDSSQATAPAAAASAPASAAPPAAVIEGPGLKIASARVAIPTPSVHRAEPISEVVAPAAPARLRPPELVLPIHAGAIEKKLIAMTPAQRAALAYRQASEHAASGHSSQSIDKALEALRADPDHLPARQLAAVLLFEKNRYEEAGALLREGLSRKPGQPQLVYLLARLLIESGDHAGALATLALADGLSSDGHGLRAGILAQLGRYGEALKCYEAAVRLDPDNASWWLGLGVALDAEGQTAPAKLAFQRARSIGSLRGDVLSYIDQKLAN